MTDLDAITAEGTAQTLCVIYAAKSTQDRRGSIPTQIEDCRRAAAERGWQIVSEHTDEGFSAYSRNRGPGLARARAEAGKLAAEVGAPVMLLAQHSDRFSRGGGDRPGAAEALVEIWHAERRRSVHLRSVEDDFDLQSSASVANIGERNRADSERKSRSTAAGKARRFERGDAVGGPINDGYRLVQEVIDGAVIKRRELHPERAPIIARIFDLVEAGHAPGDVARRLNAEGVRTRKGRDWTARTVREIIENPYFAGRVTRHGVVREGNHPALIDPPRWEAIQTGLRRLDPAAVQQRKGGRRAADQSYLLRGVAFCGRCGSSLYTRRYASGRHYVCSAVREARGTCNAPPIPAPPLEHEFVENLNDFFADLRSWIRRRAAEHDTEREALEQAVRIARDRLADAARTVEKVEAHYLSLVAEDDDLASIALRQLAAAEATRDDRTREAEDAAARLAEWTAAPAENAVLTFYADVRAVVMGRVAESKNSTDLAAALRTVLQGVWVDRDGDGDIRIEAALTETLETLTGDMDAEQAWRSLAPVVEARMAAARRVERDGTGWCTSTPGARRSRRTRVPRPSATAR